MLHSTSIAKAQSATIAETLATLNRALTAQRPTISISDCNTPGCTCCPKGGRR